MALVPVSELISTAEAVMVGAVVSTTNAALAARDPVAPEAASVRIALLPAASLIVPPFRSYAVDEC